MITTNETGGYIYILVNESLPGLIKVGMTTKAPHLRARELHTTGIPTPFEVAAFWSVPRIELKSLEKKAHKTLHKYRVSGDREFFRIDVQLAKQTLTRLIPSPEQQQIEREIKLQRELDSKREAEQFVAQQRAEMVQQRSSVLQQLEVLECAVKQRENPWFRIFHCFFAVVIGVGRFVIAVSGWAILFLILARTDHSHWTMPSVIIMIVLWLGTSPFLKELFGPSLDRLGRLKDRIEPTHAMKRREILHLKSQLEVLDSEIAREPLY